MKWSMLCIKSQSMVLGAEKFCCAHRVLLLLDLDSGAILERPFDDVGLVRGALDPLALLKG